MIREGQRKFVVAMTGLLMGFVLAVAGILAGAEFVTLVGLVVGLFGGANVVEHLSK